MENTWKDLQDVYEHISDNDLSEREEKYKQRIISLYQDILEESGRLEEIIDERS